MSFMFYLNVALGIGFSAWALGIFAIFLKKDASSRLVSVFSFALCMGALLCPLLGLERLERMDAFSQLYDLTTGLVFGAVMLILVTLALNCFALFRRRKH